MIRVLLFIAVLAALSFAGVWLLERPGEVVMTVEGYRIETSLIAAVGAVMAAALALLLLWLVVRFVLRLPGTISLYSRTRRRARGFAAISRGMVAVGAGDPRAAKRFAADAGKLLGDEPLALLLRAQAAQMAGDRGSAEGAFRRMLDEPETRVLGLRGLFVEARRKGDAAAARAYAAEASRLAPTVSWAGEALLEYQCADHDWTGALATLERGAKGLDKAAVRRHRAVLLTAEAMDRAEKQPDVALSRAQEALKLAPALVPAAALAARLLARRGDLRKASRTIETVWSHSPHPDLVAAYVNVRPGDSAKDRLSRAEKLFALRPHDAESRIAVATEALAAHEPARAREVLRPLLEADERPGMRVCLLMADIEEMETGSDGAVREWFARASRAPRDPAWIADGVISSQWAPISPVSGRLDAFVWGTPMEQLPDYDPDRPAPGDRARFHLASHDAVLADMHEPVALAPSRAAEAEAATPAAASAMSPASEPRPDTDAASPAASSSASATAPGTIAADSPQQDLGPAPPSRAGDAHPAEEETSARLHTGPASKPALEAGATGLGELRPANDAEPAAAVAPPDRDKAGRGASLPGEVAQVPGPHAIPEPRPRDHGEPARAPLAAASEPAHGPRVGAGLSEARGAAASRPVADARTAHRGGLAPVVFPLPSPPDDPGPDRSDPAERGRIGFLQ